uniref:CSON007911 protein n=2 Tax=Culicoides sonorensis TaxID=179676 RepID=A0A336LD11_CULSO
MPEQNIDYRVVVFGAGGVGKSSLVLRFIKGTFKDSYIPTIEDTYRQVISCNKNICTLQITDTTGSHQFPAMQRLSITKMHACILVYSVSSRQSLEELRQIWALIKELRAADLTSIPVMLVGNKCDESAELREVSTAEGQAEAATWGVSFMETSAKTNHNVTELFQELLNMEKTRNVSLNLDSKSKKKLKNKKNKEQNGATAGEASGEGGSGVKEKCQVM